MQKERVKIHMHPVILSASDNKSTDEVDKVDITLNTSPVAVEEKRNVTNNSVVKLKHGEPEE
eukprot:3633627-Ditylum_brightwellii.AAC.1